MSWNPIRQDIGENTEVLTSGIWSELTAAREGVRYNMNKVLQPLFNPENLPVRSKDTLWIISSEYVEQMYLVSRTGNEDDFLSLVEDFYSELEKKSNIETSEFFKLLIGDSIEPAMEIDRILPSLALIEILLWFALGYVRWERVEDDGEWEHDPSPRLACIFRESIDRLFGNDNMSAILQFRKNLILDPNIKKSYESYLSSRTMDIRMMAHKWIVKYSDSEKDLNQELYESYYLSHENPLLIANDMLLLFGNTNRHIVRYNKIEDGICGDGQMFYEMSEYMLDISGMPQEEQYLLVSFLHHPGIMMQIERSIGIEFRDYPFSIQPHFLNFLAYATIDDMARVKTYLSHGKTTEEKFTRLRVFLATAEGRSFGDLILDIDNKLIEKFGEMEWTKIGNELFEKYMEIMDIAEEDAESIRWEFYGADSNAQFSKQKYIQELLGKANDTLKNFSEILDNEASSEVIIEHFATCNANMIQYGTLFRVTEKNFDTKKSLVDSLKELGIELVEKTGPEMNIDDRAAMMNLYEANYQSHPKKAEFFANATQVLEWNYRNPKSKFFLLRYRWSPLLSAKFVEQDDGSIYFGAFNTALYFQQNNLGILVLEKLLSQYSDKLVRGHVMHERKDLIRYYGRYWFEREKDGDGFFMKPDMVGKIEFCRMIRELK